MIIKNGRDEHGKDGNHIRHPPTESNSSTNSQTKTESGEGGTRVTGTSELDLIQIKKMLTRLYKMVH